MDPLGSADYSLQRITLWIREGRLGRAVGGLGSENDGVVYDVMRNELYRENGMDQSGSTGPIYLLTLLDWFN